MLGPLVLYNPKDAGRSKTRLDIPIIVIYHLPTYHTLFVKFHRETPVSTRNDTGSSDSPRRKQTSGNSGHTNWMLFVSNVRICQPRLFHDLDLGRVSLIWMRRKNPPQIIIQWHSPSWNESWKNINQVGISFRSESVTNSSISAGGGIYVIFIHRWELVLSSKRTVPPTPAQLHLEVWVCQPTLPPQCLAVPATRLGTKLQSPGPAILDVVCIGTAPEMPCWPTSKSSIGPPERL